ncbi:MAG TPA: hypothetical protein VFB75_18555 [Burkholderiales bacterium]|nr:hypothetical protein [Burkholderiales bacterium]
MVAARRAFVLALSLLPLALVPTCGDALAAADTYRGLLLPDNLSLPIPISVELDSSRRQLSGRVSTSVPLTGEGRVVSGEKKGYDCNFKSDIGAGRTFTFAGFCLPSFLEGKYTLRMPDGSLLKGELRLSRLDPKKREAKGDSDELLGQPGRTVTHCITANTACLAGCPRGDHNAEFVCSNRCRQKFTACKTKATTARPALP